MHNLTSKIVTLGEDDVKINYHLIEQKLSILPIILTIVGTIGNLIAFYVLTRKKLRKQSTMLYFATLTCMDTLSLYQWNFNFFYKYRVNQLNQNLEDQSLFLCRYISFMGYFSMQTCALILVLISIDRYLIITNNNWKQKYSKNVKFNLFVIISAIFFVALINLPVSFLNGKYSTSNSHKSKTTTTLTKLESYDFFNQTSNNNLYAYVTTPSAKLIIYTTTSHISTLIPIHVTPLSRKKVECYTTSYILFYQKLTFLLECVIPLILMILFNFLLIKRTYNSSTKFSMNSQANNHVSTAKKDNNTPNSKSIKSVNKDSNSNVASSNNHLNAINNLPSKNSTNYHSLKVSSSPNNPIKKSASFHSNNLVQNSSTSSLTQINTNKNSNSAVLSVKHPKKTAHIKSCYDLSQKKNLLHTNKKSRLSAHRNSSITTRVIQNDNLPSDCSNSDNSSAKLVIPRVSSSIKLKNTTDIRPLENNSNLNENPINISLANLEFLQYGSSIYEKNLTYIEPDLSYYLNKQDVINEEEEIASTVMNQKNEANEEVYGFDDDDEYEEEEEDDTGGEISKTKDSDQSTVNYNLKSNLINFSGFSNNQHSSMITINKNSSLRGRHSVLTNAAYSTDHRRMSSLRNRRIVVMLSLLTISFAVSTLPSSVFYTFFRPILNKKPYRRLLSLSFNLLRHLSHTFNFIIYFTFSSVIKQQLKDTLNDLNAKILLILNMKFFQKFCCCLIYIIPHSLKKQQQQQQHTTTPQLNIHKNNSYAKQKKNNTKNKNSDKKGQIKTDNNNNNNNTEQSFVSINVTNLGNNRNTNNYFNGSKSIFKINSNNNRFNPKKASLITNQNLNSIIDAEHSSADIRISTPNLNVDTNRFNGNNSDLFYNNRDTNESKFFHKEEDKIVNKKVYESVSFKVPSSGKNFKKETSNNA